MTKLYNVLQPTRRGRTQTAKGTNFGQTVGRAAVHWGTDLRPTVAGVAGDPVYLPVGATLVAQGIGNGGRAAPVPYHSGRYQLWDLGDWGGDRMYLYFGHLDAFEVEHVKTWHPAGTLVARVGGSGANGRADAFAAHLHIGVAQNTTAPLRMSTYAGQAGWIDPVAWFGRHGVNFDTSPVAPAAPIAPPVIIPAAVEVARPAPVVVAPTPIIPKEPFTMEQYNEILRRLDAQDREIAKLVNSGVTAVIRDRSADDKVTVAGAHTRELALIRALAVELGELRGLLDGKPFEPVEPVEPPVDPVAPEGEPTA